MHKTFQKSLDSGKPVLAAFVSAGNQNAVDIHHLLNQLDTKLNGKADFVMVDCSYHPALRKKYKIDNYPTLILFRGNEELWRGNTHKAETIIESINTFLN